MTATLSQSAPKRYQIFLEDGLKGVKPIFFNTDMVRAIQAHVKTETRRKLTPQPPATAHLQADENSLCWSFGEESDKRIIKPPYSVGDILYVRETWTRDIESNYIYKADYNRSDILWRPSIHMPRNAARIFLRVLSIHAEKLQDITVSGVRSEGISFDIEQPVSSWRRFVRLWDSTIKPADLSVYGYAANPWVWVIRFVPVRKEEAFSIP